MNKENPNQKGIIERFGYLSRNVEITVGVIAALFGHYGFAALMAIGATIDHSIAKYSEKRRLRKSGVIFQAKPQRA